MRLRTRDTVPDCDRVGLLSGRPPASGRAGSGSMSKEKRSLRALIAIIVATCLIAIGGANAPATAAGDNPKTSGPGLPPGEVLGRETLPPNDGWASFTTGTTGGSAATPDHVYTVTNRQELVAALADPAPKIIYVQGTIDANVDDNNQPLSCDDYAAPGYSLEAYLQAYDPATWGRTSRPSGPLEQARQASQVKQQQRVRINVSRNTTIVGLDDDAQIRGANLRLDGVDNVIIRNITFQDAYDCFPQWDPTDSSTGNWNSQYDNIWVRGATHVWVDHSAFNDGDNPDSAQPLYFDRPYQVHDGELDITNAADLVTVSWNRFTDHDKVMLIGSSDSATADRGKLRVTLHHNLFENTGQRTPRVRFGQVHVYNNYYVIANTDSYVYSWGVGVESKIYAENNYFSTDGVTPDQFIRRFNGTAIHASGTFVNGRSAADQVDVLAAYNTVNEPDLGGDVGWTPTLYTTIHPTQAVPGLVGNNAGPFRADRAGAPGGRP
jgi:pectate lyase